MIPDQLAIGAELERLPIGGDGFRRMFEQSQRVRAREPHVIELGTERERLVVGG